ncbi:MAG TPA: 50S ribosomal protein L3 [bacterium]|nr:50S ribosomal protein L3 [bacterium]
MIKAILGTKIGMTTVFDEKGRTVPVTVIEAGPMTVMQVKTPEKDKYSAVQMGYGDKKPQRARKAETGHAKKAGAAPKKLLKEMRADAEALKDLEPGKLVTLADLGFNPGDYVDVVGTSIGKGFAGVMKKYHFHGHDSAHGAHEYKRHAGSIGTNTSPGRTLKGMHMAGRMGHARVTVKNLAVVEVRADQNLILIKGAVPGHANTVVMVRKSKKPSKKQPAAA